ncbi:SRPBCC domain-containing protein [Helcobacillus massiliensis]|uniref:SRPBCC domain-containing protein n=1 Tax=Helcobacillus massiliensis TaxID=521392 RepID=UPI0021A75F7A|nr:SRPBCC domain-containing protein [Helcobacillus massiliensis]MCT1558444.1 SRPBCC domain-containing protein [Helcobacillus massiliensis]MCT2037008.1 SRPBCC domain-containing protein [Helcobacillus massiliensis]MCT2332701.1 SRPBCC domain-containing protein [Helcobacillus massiliensis]
MSINAAVELSNAHRAVLAAGPVSTVTVSRTVEAGIEAVWQALTDPDQLPGWFGPAEGDLREGGDYTLPTNGASGTITRCECPSNFALTWESMGQSSTFTASLAEHPAGGTQVTLTHVVPGGEHWERFGPGAVGVAWEGALLALALFLAGDPSAAPEEMAHLHEDEQGRAYIEGAARAWGQAHAAGGGDPEAAAQAAERTAAFYTGQAAPEDEA